MKPPIAPPPTPVVALPRNIAPLEKSVPTATGRATSTASAPPDGEATEGESRLVPAKRVILRNDPDRVRGEALRVSLYFTLVAWIPGAFWLAATAGASANEFAVYLGANDFVLALISAAPLVAVLFQLPGSVVSDMLGKRKKFFILTVTPHRTLYILIGLLPWITPRGSTWPAMLMALLLLVSMALNAFGGQAWTSWMADLVPARVRGKYFARRSRLGVSVFSLTSLAIALVLDALTTKWFQEFMAPASAWAGGMPPLIIVLSVVFMLGGTIGMLDILAFAKVDEPPMKAVPREPLLKRLIKPLKDREFRRFVIYWSGWNFAAFFNGWVWWKFILNFLKHEKSQAVHSWWADHMYLTATLILACAFQCGGFMGYPIWGRAVDRFGRKPVLFISSTLHTAGWIWWIFLGPVMLPWLMLTQLFSGFMSGGQEIAAFNMMLQFNRKGGTAYQSLAAVIFGVVGAASAILSGALSTLLERTEWHWTVGTGTSWEHTFTHYSAIIALGVLLKYASDLILLPRVIDTGDKTRTQALRFVFDNMYGNLNTLIFEPIKTGVEMTRDRISDVTEVVTDTLQDAGTEIRRWWR